MRYRHLPRALRALFRPQDNQGIVDQLRTVPGLKFDCVFPFFIHIYLDPLDMLVPDKLKRDRAIAAARSDPSSGYVNFFYSTMLTLSDATYRVHNRTYARAFRPVGSKLIKGDLYAPPYYAVYDASGEEVARHIQADIKRIQRLIDEVSQYPSMLYCADFYLFSKPYIERNEDPCPDFILYLTQAVSFMQSVLKYDTPRIVWQVSEKPALL